MGAAVERALLTLDAIAAVEQQSGHAPGKATGAVWIPIVHLRELLAEISAADTARADLAARISRARGLAVHLQELYDDFPGLQISIGGLLDILAVGS